MGEHITLGICVFQVGEQISPGICVSPVRKKHITRDIGFPDRGTQITRDTCFQGGGTHITRDTCFPGGGTHITGDMCFPGGGNTYHQGYLFPGRGRLISRDVSQVTGGKTVKVAGDSAACRRILTTLPMHPRNLGSEKIVRTSVRTSPLNVSRNKNFTFHAAVRLYGKLHSHMDF